MYASELPKIDAESSDEAWTYFVKVLNHYDETV